MCVGIYVKYLLFLWNFNEIEYLTQIFEKISNIKFHENPYSGSRVILCELADGAENH